MSDTNYLKNKPHISLFKQIGVQYNVELPKNMNYIDKIIDTHISVKIQRVKRSSSVEKICERNKGFDGKCILIIGKIISGIEYITREDSLHYMENTHFFSTYIMTNNSIDSMNENVFKISIADSYVKKMDKDKIFQSTLILIHTTPEIVLDKYYCDRYIEEGSKTDIPQIRHRLLKYRERTFSTESLYSEVIQLNDKVPSVKKIISALVEPKIISYKVINTIEGNSEEGQHLSGKMLMVEMNIRKKLLYIAENKQTSIHGLEHESLHIVYIVIPSIMTNSDAEFLIKNHFMDIEVQEELISVKKINEKKIYTSINLYIELSYGTDM